MRKKFTWFSFRSGFTFLSGIFVYAITWIVLRTDSSSENLTYSQWKDFMVGSFKIRLFSPSLTTERRLFFPKIDRPHIKQWLSNFFQSRWTSQLNRLEVCLNLYGESMFEYVGKELNRHVSPRWIGDEVLPKMSLVSPKWYSKLVRLCPTFGLNLLLRWGSKVSEFCFLLMWRESAEWC